KPEKLPGWFKGDFKGATDEDERLYLRAATQATVGKRNLIVVSAVPVDEGLLQRIAGKLGRVDLTPDTNIQLSLEGDDVFRHKAGTERDNRKKEPASAAASRLVSGGALPQPINRFDQRIWFISPLKAVDWRNG